MIPASRALPSFCRVPEELSSAGSVTDQTDIQPIDPVDQ
jgi:hypothetical protein